MDPVALVSWRSFRELSVAVASICFELRSTDAPFWRAVLRKGHASMGMTTVAATAVAAIDAGGAIVAALGGNSLSNDNH